MSRSRFIALGIVVALLVSAVAIATTTMPRKPAPPMMAKPSGGPAVHLMAVGSALKDARKAGMAVKAAAKKMPMDMVAAKKNSAMIAADLKAVNMHLGQAIAAMTPAQKTKTAMAVKSFKTSWALASKTQKALAMELAKPAPNAKMVAKAADTIEDTVTKMMAILKDLMAKTK